MQNLRQNWNCSCLSEFCKKSAASVEKLQFPTLPTFLLLTPYIPNVPKRSIWDQCNIEDQPIDDRPLLLEKPSWKNIKWPYLHNGAR